MSQFCRGALRKRSQHTRCRHAQSALPQSSVFHTKGVACGRAQGGVATRARNTFATSKNCTLNQENRSRDYSIIHCTSPECRRKQLRAITFFFQAPWHQDATVRKQRASSSSFWSTLKTSCGLTYNGISIPLLHQSIALLCESPVISSLLKSSWLHCLRWSWSFSTSTKLWKAI